MSNSPSQQATATSAILPDFNDTSPTKLGLELEMFGFDARTLAPLGTPGAKLTSQALMERIQANVPGSHVKVDAATGVIVGLELACGNFSLEPGGQLEYASCPQSSLEGVLGDLRMGLELLEEAARGDVLFLDHGTNPVAGPDLELLVPKHRYQILTRYFQSQPQGRGVHMMRYSATAQPNIDVGGGREAWEEAVNLTFLLTPFVRHLFANSRYLYGQLLGAGSERQRIWAAIDSTRTGIPEGVTGAADLPQAYVDWARRANVFLAGDLPLEEQPQYGELTFEQWETKGYRGTHPGTADWENHLGTLFPDLRLRRFLEVRMVDAQSYEHALAPMAFWTVALQNPRCREQLGHLLTSLATQAGLKNSLELLKLGGDDATFSRPQTLTTILKCVEENAGDDLARRSLSQFGDWLHTRDGLTYPASGADFVQAQATTTPSRLLGSLLGV